VKVQNIDVLLVTVTEVEARAILNVFPNSQTHHIGDQTYRDLGTVKGARIFMVQSEMGPGGPAGSTLTIEEAIRLLNPSTVIMVGIAFGIAEGKQNMGEILVSTLLIPYDLQRVGTNSKSAYEILLRGDRPSVSHRLLQRFRAAANDWKIPPTVEFGSLLTGAKLIDNQDFRDQLLRLTPEAIGGEMEGSGLYAAAQRKKVDWIVVKAICDWADGNKSQDKKQRQQRAAENAARFTIAVLEQGGFETSRNPSRRGVLIGLSGLAGAGAVIVGGGLLYLKAVGIDQHPSTPTPSPTAPSTPATTLIVYKGHSASVTSVCWSPDGTRIASTGYDTTIQVCNAFQGGNLLTYTQNTKGLAVWSVAWSPNGHSIAAAGADQTAKVWNVTKGGNPIVYSGHHDQVTALAWSPTNSQLIASGSGDTTVQVWNALQGGNPLLTFTGHTDSITSVAWSPNGRYIAAGSVDKTVMVWDATIEGNPIIRYTHHSEEVKGIAWSPDSMRLASGSYDNTVQVWDVLSATLLLTYSRHTGHVNPVDWSPNGRYIASGSWDKTVHIWDATGGLHLFTYTGHSDHINSVKWSPGGNLLASGSVDNTARVWRPS